MSKTHKILNGLTNDQKNIIKDAVYKIADAEQSLKDLATDMIETEQHKNLTDLMQIVGRLAQTTKHSESFNDFIEAL